ncbi:ankyrin repeat domain-containing protein [Endozoicomonas sp. ONNA2]|uniref:ankyrin repeat domain-containing protein n=1 Tax=Endozoicomonas sp. ONNA2 TaxID=2828741 RepID=UPI0021480948
MSLLYIAVIGRYVELARLLIEKGADVNYALKKGGFTALTCAAQIGFIEIVQLLIDNGANIDQAGNDGATPLYYAAQEGHTEIVKLLLAYDADPEKEWKMFSIGRLSFTKSPLSAAQILSGDKESAQMIATAIKERKINLSGEFPPLLAGQHASYGTIR